MATRILKYFKYFILSTTDIIAFLLYLLVHAAFTVLKIIFNISTKAASYETSAEVLRVLWKRKWLELAETSPRDFLTWPLSKAHPNYVLRSTVSLYAITKYEAVFVETPPGKNIFQSDINPFLYIAQFKHCERVITMPIKSFHRLAREMGGTSSPIIWITNTGRCGSTIVGQIFESVPGTILMSEHDALTNLAYMRVERVIAKEEHEELLTSAIKIICKPRSNATRICMKTRSCGLVHMEPLSRLFPQIKQIFLYRNALETCSSFLEAFNFSKLLTWINYCADSDKISHFIPVFRNLLISILAIKQENQYKNPCDMNRVEMITTMWASAVVAAKNIKSRDKNLLPLKYEDLIADPRQLCMGIFKAVEIEVSAVENAVHALQKDSQAGTVLSKRSTGKDPWRHFSQSDRRKANFILSKYELPLLGEEFKI